jgi:hypothetical protein
MVSDMAEIDPVKFGLLIGQVKTLENQVADMQQDVKELLEIANRVKGGIWLGGVGITMLSGVVSWLVAHFR